MKVNIFSDEWCDLIFENKNKEYGAYKLRKLENKRVAIATVLASLIFIAAFSYPLIMKAITPTNKIKNIEVLKPTIINFEENKVKDVIKKSVEKTVDVAKVRNQVKFIIKLSKDEVKGEDIKTQDEYRADTRPIGGDDVTDGSDDPVIPVSRPEPEVKINDDPPKIFINVPQMPQFPGGDEELMKYLRKNISFPELARTANIQGTVHILFVVNPEGRIINIKILRGIGGGCDEEAVRVIKKMPLWSPGRQNGIPVHVQLVLPVKFTLR